MYTEMSYFPWSYCSLTGDTICCPLASESRHFVHSDVISAAMRNAALADTRASPCLSMDVLYAVTYRMKPYCTLGSENINGASFCCTTGDPLFPLRRTPCRIHLFPNAAQTGTNRTVKQ